MDFSDKKVLVIGTGISGISAARLLINKGAGVILCDADSSLDKGALLSNFDPADSVDLYLGELPKGAFSADLLVLSPGVPADIPLVEEFKEKDIPVWGEVELAYRCGKGEVLAVTGTNGKTTTTALLGEILRGCFDDVRVVGNIGIPYTGAVGDTTEESVTVAEISSFQLETAVSFRPHICAVLNITPDHLNRHHDMEEYASVKMRIAARQTEEDVCVLNYEDELCREYSGKLRSKTVYFSSLRRLDEGLYLEGDRIIYADGEKDCEIIRTGELNIPGRHNYENVMAACAMALCFGVPVEKIRCALRKFTAVEHRIEFVAEKRGVRYYNDSKGTNPDAAIKGIEAMDRPTCLIGGGYDKDSEYSEWIKAFDGKVKVLALIGQTREKIAAEAASCGFTDFVLADSLEEAFEICRERAVSGDAVLLSPACASWGMFPNYEARGNLFKQLVNAIGE